MQEAGPRLRSRSLYAWEIENATINSHYGFVFEENSFTKSSTKSNPPTLKRKAAFLNFSDLKSVSEKLRFRDNFVWMI